MAKERNQISRDLEEIWDKDHDPVEREKKRLKKNRERREEDKKKDLGL